ncbi:MAG: hypothetical protein AAB834_05735, partial [Patescibacteria group bacterium]
ESTSAQPGDRISYTITAQNTGSQTQPVPLAVPLADILEYAKVIDNGGGTVDDKETKTLSWPSVSLDASEIQQRTFVIQLSDPIPATPIGQSNAASFDCILTISFGTSVAIPIACPETKIVETTAGLLPTVGITGNLIFASVVAFAVFFFYYRTKQLKKEIRLIRHTLNNGTL